MIVKMKSGREAVICLTTPAGIFGYYIGRNGEEVPTSWRPDGRWLKCHPSSMDLVIE